MTSVIINLVGNVSAIAIAGATSYVVCRVSNQPNPFEKTVLATVLIGFQLLGNRAIKYQQRDRDPELTLPRNRVLNASAYLLAIPFALYAGRVFSFKATDYLQIVGLADMGCTILVSLEKLYRMFLSEDSK